MSDAIFLLSVVLVVLVASIFFADSLSIFKSTKKSIVNGLSRSLLVELCLCAYVNWCCLNLCILKLVHFIFISFSQSKWTKESIRTTKNMNYPISSSHFSLLLSELKLYTMTGPSNTIISEGKRILWIICVLLSGH